MGKEEPKDRLRNARKRAGYRSMTAFAEAFNIPAATYKSHEIGIRGMTDDVIQHYADLLKVDAEWIKTGHVSDPASDPDYPPPSKELMEVAIEMTETILEEQNIKASAKSRTHMATEIYFALERKRKKGIQDNDVSADLIDHLVAQVHEDIARSQQA